jgi:hypothetical protein
MENIEYLPPKIPKETKELPEITTVYVVNFSKKELISIWEFTNTEFHNVLTFCEVE